MRDVPAADVRRAVKTKGFREAEHGRRDHEMYFFYDGDRKTNVFVKISHGSRYLHKGEIGINAKNIRIAAGDLFKIVSCELDAVATAKVLLANRT